MENNFSGNIITITDEENNEYEFEHLDTIELNSKIYLAFIEAGSEDDSEDALETIILRLDKDENGEEILSTIDDEDELEAAYNAFLDNMYDDEEDDE